MDGVRPTNMGANHNIIPLLIARRTSRDINKIIWRRVKRAFTMALIDFLLNFGRLKRVPRTGWLLRGVSLGDVESVAEHTLRASILSIFIARLLNSKGADVDTLKVAEMAVLHDLAEAMILDMDQEVLKEIGYERKREMEHAAEGMLLEELPEDLKLKYRRLLDELHEGKSLEARIVKASDKLEMMIQALEYSSKYSKAILRAFRQDVNEVEDFSLDEVSELIIRIKSRLEDEA